MNFYSYSVPTLDLNNREHRELVRQFVLACKLELQKRTVKTGRKPFAEPPECSDDEFHVLERSSHSAPVRRRRTPCST